MARCPRGTSKSAINGRSARTHQLRPLRVVPTDLPQRDTMQRHVEVRLLDGGFDAANLRSEGALPWVPTHLRSATMPTEGTAWRHGTGKRYPALERAIE